MPIPPGIAKEDPFTAPPWIADHQKNGARRLSKGSNTARLPRPGALFLPATVLRSLTSRDLRWAVFVAALVAISPLSGSARAWLSALLGAVGGVAFLGMLAWYRRNEGPPEPRPAVLAWPGPPVLLALLGVLLVFAPTLPWLYGEYTNSVWRNVHGLTVPVFVFLLARSALRREGMEGPPEASPWGFAFLAAGMGLAVIDAGVGSHTLATFGLVLCLPGLSLLFLGAPRTRSIAPVLAFACFAIPTPAHIRDALWMVDGSTRLAEPLIHAVGVPVVRFGPMFVTRQGVVAISQNCSGLSALHAAFAFASVLAITSRSWRRAIWPLLLAYPVTLGLNALRSASIVIIHNEIGPAFMHTAVHGLTGLLVIWGALFLLWLICDHQGLREGLS